MKIIGSGSVDGLNRLGAYTDVFSYFHTMCYARHRGLGLHIYGEVILIAIQNFTILMCFYKFDKSVQLREKAVFLALFSVYAFILLQGTMVPEPTWKLIISTGPMCSAFGRFSQMYSNWRNGSTGQLAIVTLLLQTFINTSRMVVTLLDTADWQYRLNYVCSAMFIWMLLTQYLYINYWTKFKARKPRSKKVSQAPRRSSTSPSKRSVSRKEVDGKSPRRSQT